MPRSGRGGRRQPRAGGNYGNRSDLQGRQAVKAPPSTSYGEGARLERAQEAIPLPQTAGAPPMAAAPPAGPLPGEVPFGRPTERPMEPLTAGLPIGAGPGPSATMPSVDPVADALRAAYRAFPNNAIGSLLEAIDERGQL